MSHKFKVGDKVRIENLVGSAEVLTNDMRYKLNSDPHDLSTLPLYDVRYGNQVLRVLEEGLEKIEEPAEEPNPKPEPKYKIGDVVFFVCNVTTNEQIEGEIKNIKNGIYTIEKKQHPGYFFSLAEKYITDLAPLEEFKEGDEVWIKVKIGRWPNTAQAMDSAGDIKIHLPHHVDGNFEWAKPEHLHKSISSKNEWVRVKDRVPCDDEWVHIITKFKDHHIARYITEFNNGWLRYIFETTNDLPIEPDYITHWKPLDAPPNE